MMVRPTMAIGGPRSSVDTALVSDARSGTFGMAGKTVHFGRGAIAGLPGFHLALAIARDPRTAPRWTT